MANSEGHDRPTFSTHFVLTALNPSTERLILRLMMSKYVAGQRQRQPIRFSQIELEPRPGWTVTKRSKGKCLGPGTTTPGEALTVSRLDLKNLSIEILSRACRQYSRVSAARQDIRPHLGDEKAQSWEIWHVRNKRHNIHTVGHVHCA
jgi:hypothetical protein